MTTNRYPPVLIGHQLFATITILAFICFHPTTGTIVVLNRNDTVNTTIIDTPANFGASLVDLYMNGAVVETNPENKGCQPSDIPPAPLFPPFNDTRAGWFVVLMRGDCTFALKAYNAMQQGYDALIVRNDANTSGRSSLICGGNESFSCSNITIFVTMVANFDGHELATKYTYAKNVAVTINGPPSENYLYYILPFLTVVGIVLIVVAAFFVVRFVRDLRIARKARLSRWALRKIPTRKFKKGTDHYDCCSICLDDFVDGDKLRILFCDHAYHQKCIDPWLLNNRRNCPVCKRKVRVPGEVDSDDEEEAPRPTSSSNVNINAETGAPIAEGVSSNMDQGGSDDNAPLIRRDPTTGLCCIPRSYHSTESLNEVATSSAAVPGMSEHTNRSIAEVEIASPPNNGGDSTETSSVSSSTRSNRNSQNDETVVSVVDETSQHEVEVEAYPSEENRSCDDHQSEDGNTNDDNDEEDEEEAANENDITVEVSANNSHNSSPQA